MGGCASAKLAASPEVENIVSEPAPTLLEKHHSQEHANGATAEGTSFAKDGANPPKSSEATATCTSLTKQEGVGEPMKVKVVTMSGSAHMFEVVPTSSLLDLKFMICDKLGHPTGTQKLLLESVPLFDLRDVTDGAILTLVIIPEPLGQSLLETPAGLKRNVGWGGTPYSLTKIEFQSWKTAWQADRARQGCWTALSYDPGEGTVEDQSWNGCKPVQAAPWGNIGAGGVDFYWTTQSDGCRYEYWSTDPGDNEYGLLIRVDATSMRAIGEGSDDGIELFAECADEFDDEVLAQLRFGTLCVGGRCGPGYEDESDSEDSDEGNEPDDEV